MTEDLNEKMLRRVQNILARAESTTSEGEREECFRQASKIMQKASITQAMLDNQMSNDDQRDTIMETSYDVYGQFVELRIVLLCSIAKEFGCRYIYIPRATGRNRRSGMLYGTEKNTAYVDILFNSLCVQHAIALNEAVKNYRETNSDWFAVMTTAGKNRQLNAFRESYLNGFTNSVIKRLHESRQEATEEAGSGAELVLVKRDDVVDSVVADIYPELRARTVGVSRFNSAGYLDGVEDGKRANLTIGDGPKIDSGSTVALTM